MSELRISSLSDLTVIASWIRSAELCEQWAGTSVGFPIQLDSLPEEIEFRHAESWCLLESGVLVGFGQIFPRADGRQHLAHLIVEPNFRGRGLGRQLTKRLLELALAKSPMLVSLNVSVANLTAISLYQSLGFRSANRPSSEPDSASQYMVHAA
jgi:ribosomal protein S18 acetylase RimI-like enzyme